MTTVYFHTQRLSCKKYGRCIGFQIHQLVLLHELMVFNRSFVCQALAFALATRYRQVGDRRNSDLGEC
ncbi:MAG: hypothetical protein EWM72_01467 [Nitrospira sp.]|nr:MAG: hypothetical protein EWM72_01467 [Nitrospira sp.]